MLESNKLEAVTGAEGWCDLFKLEKYTGCISCFGCKKEQFKGHCVCRDGLTEVLDAIRKSDGLIIGSPNYLSNVTASFRALYERLIFQNLTYNRETPCCNEHPIPVLFIMTAKILLILVLFTTIIPVSLLFGIPASKYNNSDQKKETEESQ